MNFTKAMLDGIFYDWLQNDFWCHTAAGIFIDFPGHLKQIGKADRLNFQVAFYMLQLL